MKKFIFSVLLTTFILSSFVIGGGNNVANAENNKEVLSETAKAAYLTDSDSGTVIYAKNENGKLPIASMTKIMTCLLVIESVERGDFSYSDNVTVSENASSMGGSQVFLDKDSVHTVENLLKTVIVASANDSAVALAEKTCGSETAFVALMNKRAAELNMTNTNFTNCTGLPSVNAYSSAKDVSVMLKQLIKHSKYMEYSKVWLEDYVHPDGRKTTITNTNKLSRFYKGCDAGKTGYTSEALFCLSASAKRGDMRVICTVIGEENGKKRFADVSRMFDYAFGNYENRVLAANNEYIENNIEITRGKKSNLLIKPAENVCVFTKKGENTDVELVYELPDKLKAPVKEGDVVGSVSVVKNGVVTAKINIVAAEDLQKANFYDSIKKICDNW